MRPNAPSDQAQALDVTRPADAQAPAAGRVLADKRERQADIVLVSEGSGRARSGAVRQSSDGPSVWNDRAFTVIG